MRTLSIGGATYDLFVRLPDTEKGYCEDAQSFSLPLGAKIRVQEVIETCGGGASNTSVGLARLGCTACFEGVLSTDQWGEKLHKNLQNEGVDTGCITFVEDEVSSFSLILSGTEGERVILYEAGTNGHLHDVTFDKDMLQEMDWIYLNHIQEGSCVIQDDIVEALTAVHTGLTWNPGGCQIDTGADHPSNTELLAHTDLILLNKQEALGFTNTLTIEEACMVLLGHGVKNIAITDGKNGTVATDGTMLYQIGVLDTHVVDTTGAGDAFGVGMTWGLLQGMTLIESLKTGNINAASVVSAYGAQTALQTDKQILNTLNTVDLPVTSHPLSSKRI